ncbi:MAG: hemin uptake protein HemP [Hydrogenophaga sp.]|jgi:hemin uptake protein HemP|uniref:hemin uptake protein HemP n=1 Tax=Hydrogenophaga sp. TaxID=1904254 RepID=UPI001E12F2EA|nr:hemin uptake protein HemP [Hydrogenophaga sp.]MBW0172629.1 hemin uptake protein HemP [Hydrogenophaga sp.]MBW0186376.1 hemin uptake protein HemP [Hydrogenophaga sp.]
MSPEHNNLSTDQPRPDLQASQDSQDTRGLPVWPSADLLRGQKAVAIDHNGSLYRLQTTRQGKLILTK